MKRKNYKIAFPAILVVVLLAFLSTIFFANVNLSFSDSGKNRSSAVEAVAATSTSASTAAHEELWNNYLVVVMWEKARNMDALNKARTENIKKMNAVERMKLHSQIPEAHLDQQKKAILSFEEFHTIISEEEKNSIDIVFQTGTNGVTDSK
jgi:hypothetical protein